jgi:hypothetical protein
MRAAVQQVLGEVPFELPVTLGYCVAVMDKLKLALPGTALDVYHRYVNLVVRARQGTARYDLVLDLPG